MISSNQAVTKLQTGNTVNIVDEIILSVTAICNIVKQIMNDACREKNHFYILIHPDEVKSKHKQETRNILNVRSGPQIRVRKSGVHMMCQTLKLLLLNFAGSF